MESVYYFIGSVWGASIILLLVLIYKKLNDIQALITTRSKNINSYCNSLGDRIESNQ